MFQPVLRENSTPAFFPHSLDGLVAVHRYLCRRGARKFWRPGLERSDLEQVAAVGLIKAAHRFDPSLRTPFEAFAWIAILGELMHYVRDHEGTVRVPRRLRTLAPRLARAHESLSNSLGREPSDGEIATAMGVLVTTVRDLRKASECAQPVRLEEAEIGATLAGPGISLEDRLLVQSAFSALTPVERRVIAGIYLLGFKQLELAHRLGISPKRVSRLHRAALRTMQRSWSA